LQKGALARRGPTKATRGLTGSIWGLMNGTGALQADWMHELCMHVYTSARMSKHACQRVHKLRAQASACFGACAA